MFLFAHRQKRNLSKISEPSRPNKDSVAEAHKTVKDKFLMPRLLEQYLDLFDSFDTIYRLSSR
jgi:hypothetical protein